VFGENVFTALKGMLYTVDVNVAEHNIDEMRGSFTLKNALEVIEDNMNDYPDDILNDVLGFDVDLAVGTIDKLLLKYSPDTTIEF
tara:strand:+ start:1609 stop:1863 length:255 start_codon:yes stop_codon:yes gene_type:complete